MTYWTQPYPRSVEDARAIRELLRCGGTFANQPQLKPGLSLEEVKKAAAEMHVEWPAGPIPFALTEAY